MSMGGAIYDYVDPSAEDCEDDGSHDAIMDVLQFLSTPNEAVYVNKFADHQLNTTIFSQETIDGNIHFYVASSSPGYIVFQRLLFYIW